MRIYINIALPEGSCISHKELLEELQIAFHLYDTLLKDLEETGFMEPEIWNLFQDTEECLQALYNWIQLDEAGLC
jgi:hypothetical protein